MKNYPDFYFPNNLLVTILQRSQHKTKMKKTISIAENVSYLLFLIEGMDVQSGPLILCWLSVCR
jgi:hypothetical protein